MSKSINIHHCLNITTSGVSHDNANALTMRIKTNTGDVEVILFDLPTNVADAIESLLGGQGIKPTLNETAIRADERRKLMAQFSEMADPIF